MENLGSMDPEGILQLFSGSLICAGVIFLFIIGYFITSRRGGRSRRRTTLSSSTFDRDLPYTAHRGASPAAVGSLLTSEPSGSPVEGQLPGVDPAPIDVEARLAGTGREAWLEAPESQLSDSPLMEEQIDHPVREVIRLVRDPAAGQIWTQVAGVRYRRLNEIRDRKVGERVLASVTWALRFSDGMLASDEGLVTLELPPCEAVKVPTPFGALSEVREPGEMMRIMSNPEQGLFCIYVAERCYRRLVEVQDRATGQHILEAITHLLRFTNGMLATDDGLGAVPVPPLSVDIHRPLPRPPAIGDQVSLPSASIPGSSRSVDPQPSPPSSIVSAHSPLSEEERFLRQLMQSQAPAEPEQPVERPSLIGSIRRMRNKSSAESLPILNLAQEIDRIFQGKLLASGMVAADAAVEENPEGGVRFRVGTAYYDAPDQVPDPRLREMIKLSITEWERI